MAGGLKYIYLDGLVPREGELQASVTFINAPATRKSETPSSPASGPEHIGFTGAGTSSAYAQSRMKKETPPDATMS
jgi:hypothetical protein